MVGLYKIHCSGCKRSYLTYDKEKLFCTSACQGKQEYARQHPNYKGYECKTKSKCANCQEEILGNRVYCGYLCAKEVLKKKRDAKKSTSTVPKKRGRPLPYHVLNAISEKERLRTLR